ncbi:hypothetical protein NSU_1424 [Novosphingobium pentaromativorans US6-1]|uniref:Uncharacterized protein n=1 Tax=Novosphingobium pentaromativorans US6-1 TaxID=1088721 RepID=G6EAM6_9SPHN|nr:hypothetical protein NSU_1424 [Novosphingobium pentaromativorans US6-1]
MRVYAIGGDRKAFLPDNLCRSDLSAEHVAPAEPPFSGRPQD